MEDRIKVVAIMAANPALSSILTMVVAPEPGLRVRTFEGRAGLAAYMHLVPVDLVVLDFEHPDSPADQVAIALRHDADLIDRDFTILALTRTVDSALRHAAVAAGIDEVIVKPMSPRYLVERIQSRLLHDTPHVGAPNYRGPERRGRIPLPTRPRHTFARYTDNVVPLFPRPHV